MPGRCTVRWSRNGRFECCSAMQHRSGSRLVRMIRARVLARVHRYGVVVVAVAPAARDEGVRRAVVLRVERSV
jgi:hypothetical protein